jgi:hypothetical protein
MEQGVNIGRQTQRGLDEVILLSSHAPKYKPYSTVGNAFTVEANWCLIGLTVKSKGTKMKSPKRQPPFGLRLPPDLKQWLAVKAAENRRSMNSEALFVLERYRAQQQGERANAQS